MIGVTPSRCASCVDNPKAPEAKKAVATAPLPPLDQEVGEPRSTNPIRPESRLAIVRIA
jgi:hypothetical protein